jgi:serine phosphatase RsbU (regulator of sigma subunit)
VSRRDRRFRREQRRLRRGERVILHSDGVFERRGKGDRPFGLAGIEGAVAQARGVSAAATARSIQNAVGAASPRPLEDDATVVVLAVV